MKEVDLLKIIDFLAAFRQQALWEEKTPPNTQLRSAYLNSAAKCALAFVASRVPQATMYTFQLHENNKHVISDYCLQYQGQTLCILGLITQEKLIKNMHGRASLKGGYDFDDFVLSKRVEDPHKLMPLVSEYPKLKEMMPEFDRLWAELVEGAQLDKQTLPATGNKPRQRI